MRFAAIGVLLTLAGCCGPRRWTTSDIVLESSFAVMTTIDGLQSRKFVDSCREQNPIIGNCGQRVPLALYIPVSELVHFAIAYAFHHGTGRTIYLGVTDGAELDTIYANGFLTDGH